MCPWCYIGKRRFEKAVAVLRDKGVDTPIEVVYRSYQLDPTAPVGAPTPAVDAYAKKFGGRERAEQIIGHVSGVAAGDGIEFRMDRAKRANTILCHRALHWAMDSAGTSVQGDFKERLLKAYFTDGLDVGDPDVIAECATEIGLDGASLRVWLDTDQGKAEVVADFEAAINLEISGVPAFLIDGRYMVPGAQDVDVFVNVLERVLAR